VNVHSGHLKDDQLFDCYVAARTGERLDPRAADHLSACAECVGRYDEFVNFMDELRQDADVEIDEQFPADRLDVQQQQILRRLEHVSRSARVITFPARAASSVSRSVVGLSTPRWVAAAAAAGLFIGVGLGGYFGPERLHRSPGGQQAQTAPAMTVQRPTPVVPVRASNAQVETPDDDAFLIELELALARPHTRELQAFDAMTPHVRDIDNRVR
jgi:hypothetical protein